METCQIQRPSEARLAISILPIRDGNSYGRFHHVNEPSNFDTSYKGWKHVPLVISRLVAVDFDTSYKGWKQISCSCLYSISKNFDTSYKGWKPLTMLPGTTRDSNFDTSYKGWKRKKIKDSI